MLLVGLAASRLGTTDIILVLGDGDDLRQPLGHAAGYLFIFQFE